MSCPKELTIEEALELLGEPVGYIEQLNEKTPSLDGLIKKETVIKAIPDRFFK